MQILGSLFILFTFVILPLLFLFGLYWYAKRRKPEPSKVPRTQGWLLMVTGKVPAGQDATISSMSLSDGVFKPENLTVYEGDCFVIKSIIVGKSHQLVGEVPASVFSQHAMGQRRMEMSTLGPGESATFQVRNVSDKDREFRAVFSGRLAR